MVQWYGARFARGPPTFNPRAGRRELLGVKTWLSRLYNLLETASVSVTVTVTVSVNLS